MIRYLLNPMVLMCAVWLVATAMYFLRWSVQFVFDPAEVLPVVGLILAAFGGGCALALAVYRVSGRHAPGLGTLVERIDETSVAGCWRMTRNLFLLWLVLSGAQMALMGGFPLLWLVIADGRSYREYGFPSLNGLINSLILACAMSSIYYYLVSGKVRGLWIAVAQLAYAVMIINRQMLFTMALEAIVLYLMYHCTRMRVLARIVIPVICLVVINGIIGHYRTGNDELKDLFQLRFEYSDMPGTIVWFYAYVTTPINNLINTIFSVDPAYNPIFPNTISYLLPTVLREDMFANVQLLSARLYANAFTVSTAMTDPYLDFGFGGIALFCLLFGFVSQLAWFYRSPMPRLMYCVLAQSVILSVFTNFLFYLPSIFQLFWIFLIGSKYRPSGIYELPALPATGEETAPVAEAPREVGGAA